MIDLNDIYSLSDFQRKTREHIERLKQTGKPTVLTVNGKAELIVQDASAYQALLDRLDEAERRSSEFSVVWNPSIAENASRWKKRSRRSAPTCRCDGTHNVADEQRGLMDQVFRYTFRLYFDPERYLC